MARALQNPRKAGWTFVLKFKICRGDRSVEAIKVLSTPSWGPAFLASLLVVGALGAFGVAAALRSVGNSGPVVTASLVTPPAPETPVPAEPDPLREARAGNLHHGVPTRGEEDSARDVITPLYARDPSALVMGPGGY